MSKTKVVAPLPSGPFRNRIVGHGEESPDQLLANEKNWRIHPFPQQEALTGVLTEVGYVQSVVVNKRLGEAWPVGQRGIETMVDGHMRVEVAISKGQSLIPVVYVDLDPVEESLVLASFDPISEMAVADPAKLDELLREIETGDEALSKLLADLADSAGLYQEQPTAPDEFKEVDESIPIEHVCPRCSYRFSGGATNREAVEQ